MCSIFNLMCRHNTTTNVQVPHLECCICTLYNLMCRCPVQLPSIKKRVWAKTGKDFQKTIVSKFYEQSHILFNSYTMLIWANSSRTIFDNSPSSKWRTCHKLYVACRYYSTNYIADCLRREVHSVFAQLRFWFRFSLAFPQVSCFLHRWTGAGGLAGIWNLRRLHDIPCEIGLHFSAGHCL